MHMDEVYDQLYTLPSIDYIIYIINYHNLWLHCQDYMLPHGIILEFQEN